MEKMNPEVKTAWVQALRSGEYQQTSGSLRATSGSRASYCCLGVLCDISGLGKWGSSDYYAIGLHFALGILPEEVAEWAGFSSSDPATGEDDWTRLSYQNDSGLSFADIADLIEENF